MTETPGHFQTNEAPRTRGETFERTAFTLCKIATFTLLFGRYALPLAATGAAVFFVLAYRSGQRETRCIGKHPLLIAAFWIGVVGMWTWVTFFRG